MQPEEREDQTDEFPSEGESPAESDDSGDETVSGDSEDETVSDGDIDMRLGYVTPPSRIAINPLEPFNDIPHLSLSTPSPPPPSYESLIELYHEDSDDWSDSHFSIDLMCTSEEESSNDEYCEDSDCGCEERLRNFLKRPRDIDETDSDSEDTDSSEDVEAMPPLPVRRRLF